MSKKVLRVAQIGVGGFGQSHQNMMKPFLESGDIELLAVADPMVERLKEEKAALEAAGVVWYEDYKVMLSERGGDLDLIMIATPIPLHEEMVADCLAGSGAHVYVEKPPVPTMAQLERLIGLDVEERVNVGFQLISSGAIRQARRWVEAGKFGAIKSVMISALWPRPDSYYNRATWSGKMVWNGRPVFDGPATNANSHWVNNLMFILGSGSEFGCPESVSGEFYRARPLESYDTCSLLGKFASGTEYSINFTHAGAVRIGNDFRLEGENGWMQLTNDATQAENSLGLEMDEDLRGITDARHENFGRVLARVRGESDRHPCLLRDTRGYVAATLGGLVSSGGVHSIPEAYWELGSNEGGGLYLIEGIEDLTARALKEPTSFSRLAPEWGKAGKTVRVSDLATEDLTPFFGS